MTPIVLAIALAALLAIGAIRAAGMPLTWAAMIVVIVLVMGLASSSLIIAIEGQPHVESTTDDLAKEFPQ